MIEIGPQMGRRALLAVCANALVACATASRVPQLFPLRVAEHELTIEQEFSDAEEGSVIWDASRSFLAYAIASGCADGQRILEIGSGSGAVGLALDRLGAESVVITDKVSQLPLMRRNVERNQAKVGVMPLSWGHDWKQESPTLAARGAWDLLVCCDCVYPSVSPEPLVQVLTELMQLNPSATLLLAAEYRPPPASAGPGVDHVADFFERMRAVCHEMTRVSDAELPAEWRCEDISLWRMRNVRMDPTQTVHGGDT